MVEITLKTDIEKQLNSDVDWIFFLKLGWSQKFLETFVLFKSSRQYTGSFYKQINIRKLKAPYLFLKSWDLASD